VAEVLPIPAEEVAVAPQTCVSAPLVSAIESWWPAGEEVQAIIAPEELVATAATPLGRAPLRVPRQTCLARAEARLLWAGTRGSGRGTPRRADQAPPVRFSTAGTLVCMTTTTPAARGVVVTTVAAGHTAREAGAAQATVFMQ
jgi:hypothetical protein